MLAKSACIVFLMTIRFLCTSSLEYYQCSHLEYKRCVKIADPLVREAHLIFPDNLEDIDSVCRTWNKFVDCLKRFTDECFSDEQRRKFNKAVSNSIESVHKMCMDQAYQQNYLQYASCIKKTITDMQHCGSHYSLLVDQVAEEDNALLSKATICCSQDRFKKCVEKETKLLCDDGLDQGPALKFSIQIIDKALSFLQDQCYNYIPNSGDCISFSSATEIPTTSKIVSTTSDILFPWVTLSGHNVFQYQSKEVKLPTSIPWIPSGNQISTDASMMDSTQYLGSRIRPASYGRSNSWQPVTRTQNNLYIHGTGNKSEDASTSVSSFDGLNPWHKRPDWVTTQTSLVGNRKSPYAVLNIENEEGGNVSPYSTETWYPAAGNQLSNEVDEPNQQGLSYRNNTSCLTAHFTYALIILAYIVLLIYGN